MDTQNLIRQTWNNFKAQPEIWFFYGFLLTSTLSIRKVLFFYPLQGQFNEYTGAYIYLADIFFILLVGGLVISILNNKRYYLSIKKVRSRARQLGCSTPAQMFHVEHSVGRAWNISRSDLTLVCVAVGLLVWSFASIIWSISPNVALYRSLKLFEMVTLFLFLVFSQKCSTPASTREDCSSTRGGWNIFKNIFVITIFVGVVNSLIGLGQVVLQHSVGLFWLKESLISPIIPGVAKLLFHGQRYIRAYGLFPHPNILGGFLMMSIIFTLAYWKLFHPSTIVPPQHKCSTWNILRGRRGTILALILGIQILGIILTFSKSDLIGLFLGLGYIVAQANVPRGTFCGAGVEHFGFQKSRKHLILAVIGVFSLALAYLSSLDMYSWLVKSLVERMLYFWIALQMIIANPLYGAGIGQFVLTMQEYTKQALFVWQLQPVHNVSLLIWSELGLVGLSLFGWLIWKLFHVEQFGNSWRMQNVPRPPRLAEAARRREAGGTSCEAGAERIGKEEFGKCSTWNNRNGGSGVGVDNLLGKNVPRGTFEHDSNLLIVFKGLLIGFLFISLFDHYLWDINQGQIMLWITLGLVARQGRQVLTK